MTLPHFEIPPLSDIKLLELYYYDKVFIEGMPEFQELSEERIGYLLDSYCFALFRNSVRAEVLQLEMLARFN